MLRKRKKKQRRGSPSAKENASYHLLSDSRAFFAIHSQHCTFYLDSVVPRIVLRLAVPQKTDRSDPKMPISEVLIKTAHYGPRALGSIGVRSVRTKYDQIEKGHRRIRATDTYASIE